MPQTEDQIQAQFYKTAYNQYPQIRGLLFSVPNGGSRNTLEAMKFKATGLTPGVPDMILLWDGKVYGFEFKTATGRLSEAQERIHQIWRGAGVQVFIPRSSEEALGQLQSIILPTSSG
ncbi:MAG: VRR-NUC domain-containing protein [Bacteroidota bacterium]